MTYPLSTNIEVVAVPARVVFTPSRWYVTVSVTDPITGLPVVCARHECSSLAQARTLLTEIREMAEDVSEFLPGVTATGYELAEPMIVPEVALPPIPEDSRDAAWWMQAIGLTVPKE